MTLSEWLNCEEPDLMLEVVEWTISREQLIDFVRRCWQRATPLLPVSSAITVADEYAALAPSLSTHDAVVYAAEAVLKAAQWAPDIRKEQSRQAAVLREIIDHPGGPRQTQ